MIVVNEVKENKKTAAAGEDILTGLGKGQVL